MTAIDARGTCSFEHEALIYGSDDEYVDALVPQVVEALDAGAAVFAIVPRRNADLLRSALGPHVDRVRFVAAEDWYLHPHATIAAYDAVLRELPPAASAFVIGEVQFGATETDWAAWARYEAALNWALEPHAARVVCPYDTRTLAACVVDDARRTHPYLLDGRIRQASDAYAGPDAFLRERPNEVPIPMAPPDVELQVVDDDLREVRAAFRGVAAGAGLGPSRVAELTLALNEVVTNALVHGGGAARLRIWTTDGTVTCVVDDAGDGSDDPLLGYRPPAPEAEGGYGLWLARQLFHRSDVARSVDGGLRVVLATDR